MTDSEPPHVEPKKGQRNVHPNPKDIRFSDQRGWRRACATFEVSHNHRVNGKIYELTMESLHRIYTDCYRHWKANIELEGIDAESGYHVDFNTLGVAFIFWHNPTGSLEIPEQIRIAMASLARNGGFISTFLTTYQKLLHVPHGISLIDASGYMPYDKFLTVLNLGLLSRGTY